MHHRILRYQFELITVAIGMIYIIQQFATEFTMALEIKINKFSIIWWYPARAIILNAERSRPEKYHF